MDVHHRNNYLIGAVAIAAAIGGPLAINARVDNLPPRHAVPLSWAELTPTQETELTARFQAIKPNGVVDILCLPPACSDLAQGLQYVGYQAGWDTHSDLPIMNNPHGIVVMPDDATGKAIAAAIHDATGYAVTVAPGAGAGLVIAIGTK